MGRQSYTSKNTSTHFKQNKAYKYIKEDTQSIFDYGCGRFNDNKEWCEDKGIKWLGYDPYWLDEETNDDNLTNVELNGVDCIICSNVLNVIDNLDVIEDILKEVSSLAKENTLVIFSCYKGDNSGIGRETKKDCWQRNENYKYWMPRLGKYFEITKRDDDVYICISKNSN